MGGAPLLMRKVRLAARRRDRAAAEVPLRELALLRLEDRGPLETAMEAMSEAGWIQSALGVLRSALDDPKAAPEAAFVWAAGRMKLRESWGFRRDLRALRNRPELWAQGASAWLESAADAGDGLGVRWFLLREGDRVRAYAESWASAGYALYVADAHRACVRCLSGWESRQDVRPGMLVNLVGALRALGREEEAGRVGRGALALAPDSSVIAHRLWLAFDAAVAGRRAEAEEACAAEAPLDSYFRALLRMTRAVLHAGAGEHEKARLLLSQARSVHPGLKRDGALRRTHARAVHALARARGGWATALWSLRERLF